MDPVSAERAAKHLGVSRMQVGRLIQRGDLTATRFGRVWMIHPESLNRYAAARPERGRPLSSQAAWLQLLEAEPLTLEELRRLANTCRRRAERYPARILPGAAVGHTWAISAPATSKHSCPTISAR
jgi:excisionase family DNA binding protein